MTRKDPERAELIERIKIAAKALEIPQDAVDHVIKHGSSRHRSKAATVLIDFAKDYGVSLDYLICGDLVSMFRFTALLSNPRVKAA